MTVPGSHVLVQAIMSAIDDYAERETGNREYFWGQAAQGRLRDDHPAPNSGGARPINRAWVSQLIDSD
jgi:hypothetical protein